LFSYPPHIAPNSRESGAAGVIPRKRFTRLAAGLRTAVFAAARDDAGTRRDEHAETNSASPVSPSQFASKDARTFSIGQCTTAFAA
jgi:hypothetical protein